MPKESGSQEEPMDLTKATQIAEQVKVAKLTGQAGAPIEEQREAQAVLKQELKTLNGVKDGSKAKEIKESLQGLGEVKMPPKEAEQVVNDYRGAANITALNKSTEKLTTLSSDNERIERLAYARQDVQARLGYTNSEIARAQEIAISQLDKEIKAETAINTTLKEKAALNPNAVKPSDEARREAANVLNDQLKAEEKANGKKSKNYRVIKSKLDAVKPKTWATVKLTAKDMASKIRDRLDKGGSIAKNTTSTPTPPNRNNNRSGSQSRGV